MYFSEEEAKVKACCGPPATYAAMVAVAGAIASFGKPGEMKITCRCVAADCMAWRQEAGSTGRGYCGLAFANQ